MKIENYEAAVKMREQIRLAKEHIVRIKQRVIELPGNKVYLNIPGSRDWEPTKLLDQYLVIPAEKQLALYLEQVEADIKRMEQEFESL